AEENLLADAGRHRHRREPRPLLPAPGQEGQEAPGLPPQAPPYPVPAVAEDGGAEGEEEPHVDHDLAPRSRVGPGGQAYGRRAAPGQQADDTHEGHGRPRPLHAPSVVAEAGVGVVPHFGDQAAVAALAHDGDHQHERPGQEGGEAGGEDAHGRGRRALVSALELGGGLLPGYHTAPSQGGGTGPRGRGPPVEQRPRGPGNVLHGPVEDVLVQLGRGPLPADLADELKGGCLHLLVGGGRGSSEGDDAPAHGGQVSQLRTFPASRARPLGHHSGHMSRIKNVEKRIWDVEGFAVRILWPDGRDVRGDKAGMPMYPYDRAAKNSTNVAAWREQRFHRAFPGFDVEVLDADGLPVHGNTLLSSVRDSYLED